MAKLQFIEFVGRAFLDGKAVAAYRVDADTVQIRGETCSGKIIGRVRNISNDHYEALKSGWCDGISNGDVRVTERGLTYLGVI